MLPGKNDFNKVVLIGWNGNENVGDDAMTQAILFQLLEKYKAREIVVNGDSQKIPLDEDLDHENIKGIQFYDLIYRIKLFRTWYGENILTKTCFAHADLMIIGGGSIFHSYNGMKHLYRIIKKCKAQNERLKVVAISVSAGPWSDLQTSNMAMKLFNTFDKMAVRDLRTQSAVKGLNSEIVTKYFPDIALSYPCFKKEPKVKEGPKKKRIGISLRAGYVDTIVLGRLDQLLQYVERNCTSCEIVVFEFCSHFSGQDSSETSKLLNIIPPALRNNVEVVPYSSNTWSFYQRIKELDLMICMRLHAAIISFSVQTPLVILPYSQKCIDFGKDVANIPDDRFWYEHDTVEDIERKVNYVMKANTHTLFNNLERIMDSSKSQLEYLLN